MRIIGQAAGRAQRVHISSLAFIADDFMRAAKNVEKGRLSQTKEPVLVFVPYGRQSPLWLADGYHRVIEAMLRGEADVEARIVTHVDAEEDHDTISWAQAQEEVAKLSTNDKTADYFQSRSAPGLSRKANDSVKEIRSFQGIPVHLEWLAGETRRYKNGYEKEMSADYGYMPRTEGDDGEELDIFLGDDLTATTVYFVAQLAGPYEESKGAKLGDFDEWKVILGASDEDEARAIYLAHVDDPAQLGGVIPISMVDFKRRLGPSARIAGDVLQFDPARRKPQTSTEDFADFADTWSRHDEVFAPAYARRFLPHPDLPATLDRDTPEELRPALEKNDAYTRGFLSGLSTKPEPLKLPRSMEPRLRSFYAAGYAAAVGPVRSARVAVVVPRILTLPLLGEVYKGKRKNLDVLRTHSLADGAEKTLCGRISADHVADEYSASPAEQAMPPTCPTCLRRDPRFRSASRHAGSAPITAAFPSRTWPAGAQLFHGTTESFEGDLRPGGDGLVWFADDPRLARAYVPNSGATSHFSISDFDLDRRVGPGHPWPDQHNRDLVWQMTDGGEFDAEYGPNGYGLKSFNSKLSNGAEVPRWSDVVAWLEKLGYVPGTNHGQRRYKVRVDHGQIMPADFQVPARLFAYVPRSPLRLADFQAEFGEGDLMDTQYNMLDRMREVREAGFDGVFIEDFLQSEHWGNFGHESIGLFPAGLAKLERHSVEPTTRFDSPELADWRKTAAHLVDVDELALLIRDAEPESFSTIGEALEFAEDPERLLLKTPEADARFRAVRLRWTKPAAFGDFTVAVSRSAPAAFLPGRGELQFLLEPTHRWRARVEHELRHAVDWAYGQEADTSYQLMRGDERAKRYINLPTEVRSHAGDVAKELSAKFDRLPTGATLTKAIDGVDRTSGKMLQQLTPENRRLFLEYLGAEFERLKSRFATRIVGDVVAPHTYPLPPYEGEGASIRAVAHGLKQAEPWALEKAAAAMAPHVPAGAILIPIPDSKGDTAANRALIGAIGAHKDVRTIDILHGPVRESQYDRSKAGLPRLPVEEIKTTASRAIIDLPEGEIFLVDNVAASRATGEAAARLFGRPVKLLTYADAGAA